MIPSKTVTDHPSPVSGIKLEVIQSMEPFIQENLNLLAAVDFAWQPSELLPNLNQEGWQKEVEALRAASKHLSDEMLMILIGNMITEEALPSYETWITGLEGIGRKNGTSDNPWAVWSRGWTAEENRHGKLIHTYLYLTGRVDMKAIARTIHHLIRNGFNPQTDFDPYLGLVYTSFQERVTNLAHRNTGRLALKQGDPLLAKMCGFIAGDETRHAQAYQLFFKKVLELDPNGAVLAFAEMMKRKIVMPAKHMQDADQKDLFLLHIVGAQRAGVYTARDYSDTIRRLVELWGIADLKSLSSEATQAQEYLCGLSDFFLKKAGKLAILAKLRPKFKCPWLFDRKV